MTDQDFDCIVVGDSHATALGIPALSDELKLVDLGEPGMVGLTGAWPRDAVFWERLGEISPGKPVAVVWAGNQHMSLYLVQPKEPFEVVLPDRPDLAPEPGLKIIPAATLAEEMTRNFEHLIKHVENLQAVGAKPFLIGTPPPKSDMDFVRRMLSRDGLKRLANTLGISDPTALPLAKPRLLLKLWIILQDEMHSVADRLGVPFLRVPEEAQTEEGFLKPEFYADATHANRQYGRLTVRKIAKAVAQWSPARSS